MDETRPIHLALDLRDVEQMVRGLLQPHRMPEYGGLPMSATPVVQALSVGKREPAHV